MLGSDMTNAQKQQKVNTFYYNNYIDMYNMWCYSNY